MDNNVVHVTLKWSKETYKLQLFVGESARTFKERVQALTGVPLERQKLLAKKGGWKGALKDDFVMEAFASKLVVVTLIGSAEKLPEPPAIAPKFVEDLTPEELRAADSAEEQAAMATAEGMIIPLQLPPLLRQDGKMEAYQYNRLVNGLPQKEIENLLESQTQTKGDLSGKVAMTLGVELRRAYVNDLTVLDDGTLVSGLDDGHVEWWRHGALEHDVIHQAINGEVGGVDSVIAMNGRITLASAGRGSVRLWNDQAEQVLAFPSPLPGTSPVNLVTVGLGSEDAICLVASFKITRHSDPNQFRLPPQDEAGRRRRAQAEEQEAAIQEALARISRSIQIWFSVGTTELKSRVIESELGTEPITTVVTLKGDSVGKLVCGDSAGGLRIWNAQRTGSDMSFRQEQFLQLVPQGDVVGQNCSIACMEALQDGRLVVSTEGIVGTSGRPRLEMGATEVGIIFPQAVYVMDASSATTLAVLNGHKDVVQCICGLPNGDLLTGGGKFDATLQLWKQEQDVTIQTESAKTLSDVGYVFSLAVLPDAKAGSNRFAVAAARYNTVKIFL
jgi:WD40 repeat protein